MFQTLTIIASFLRQSFISTLFQTRSPHRQLQWAFPTSVYLASAKVTGACVMSGVVDTAVSEVSTTGFWQAMTHSANAKRERDKSCFICIKIE